jgi:hypothetical protein
MNNNVCLPDRSQIAREILAYLEKHPDAQDTVEGIMQGWFPGHGIRYAAIMVQEVVKDLVLQGTILESKSPGSHAVYRLNLARRDKLKELLKRKSGGEVLP